MFQLRTNTVPWQLPPQPQILRSPPSRKPRGEKEKVRTLPDDRLDGISIKSHIVSSGTTSRRGIIEQTDLRQGLLCAAMGKVAVSDASIYSEGR